MPLERVPEAFLVDVRDFLRVLALEPWQQETSIGVDHEDSAHELRTFNVEIRSSFLRRERPELDELDRSLVAIGELLEAEYSANRSQEPDFRSAPWGELRDRARDALFHVPPPDSFRISAHLAATEVVVLGNEGASFHMRIVGTFEIFTHQLLELRCSSTTRRGRGEATMPVFGYDLVDLSRWLIGHPEDLQRERSTLDAAGPKFWFDEAAPLTFERGEGSLSVRLAVEETPLDVALTGVTREQQQQAGEVLLRSRDRFLEYRKELFDIPLVDERVTLVVMDEDWETARDRIRREESAARLISRLVARVKRLWLPK